MKLEQFQHETSKRTINANVALENKNLRKALQDAAITKDDTKVLEILDTEF